MKKKPAKKRVRKPKPLFRREDLVAAVNQLERADVTQRPAERRAHPRIPWAGDKFKN